ncbi:restriction endonuclease subunit S [Vibrio brasiliensis]|uniref:restriction endonuclease subunit S n=1 Tax=Vibrio brasiliensis TaxID=170652 RepID=UPI001EFE2D04|nr:restriction endonuclease subunit S [Vibrio brasiliensis]MCG9784933.1 restriction endonuclease subunit S [Vibrio brasiliensis]
MNNWAITSLEGKISIKHGFPFKSEFFSDKETNFIVLTPGNFHEEGGFKRQAGKEKFYTGEAPEEYLHEAGDLIVAMTEQAAGLLGSCARVPESGIYLHNQRLGLITTDPNIILKDYVYHLFKTKTVREQVRLTSSGSKVKHTSPERIYNVKVPLPSVAEQQRIVDFLDALENKIDLNNRINTELEAMAKTLYDYWFVQFDFPDANGKPYKASSGKMVYNPVLKREIPQGWSVCELGEHITFERGISYRSKDITETGTPLVNLNSFALTGKFKPNGTKYFSGSYKPEKLCNIGDLVIAITDVTRNADIIGKSFIVPDAFEGKRALISCDVALVKSNYFGNAYLERLFNSNHYHNYIKQFASGTLVLHLDLKGVNWYRTELPPRELLSRFEDFCTPLFQQRDIVLQENKKLEELRDWLLPMLMNGQVTVKPSTEPQEAQHG